MSAIKKIADTMSALASDAASILKVLLMSRRVQLTPSVQPGEIVILGNGPSLRDTIDNHWEWLKNKPKMAVNFAANAPEFTRLRPARYVLADPHFFDGGTLDPNVKRLWQNLRAVDWDMTLHVPADRMRQVRKVTEGTRIRLEPFNLTPLEGHTFVTHPLMRLGLGMPRPRNVMITAIMAAIGAGIQTIYLAGADHSWSRTLSVDDKNRVLSVQPHFYEDNEDELDRVAEEYAGYHLHDILNSLTVAFRSYHQIAAYAASLGVEIINVTPGSMIDAFPRKKLPADKPSDA